jgi:hypothetical protein
MRIHAALIWFDEHPRWLAATVASLAKVADHVVAVDGAFLRYPQGRTSSGGEQAETIHATAAASGLGCTIHTPQRLWAGDEIEKRNAALQLVKATATPFEDWMLVIDADEVVAQASDLTRHDLQATDLHAADVRFHTTESNPLDWSGSTRRLYRVLPDLRYTTTHFTMTATDPDTGQPIFVNGRGPSYHEPYESALDLTATVRLEHKHSLRTPERDRAAVAFAGMRHHTEHWETAA